MPKCKISIEDFLSSGEFNFKTLDHLIETYKSARTQKSKNKIIELLPSQIRRGIEDLQWLLFLVKTHENNKIEETPPYKTDIEEIIIKKSKKKEKSYPPEPPKEKEVRKRF